MLLLKLLYPTWLALPGQSQYMALAMTRLHSGIYIHLTMLYVDDTPQSESTV